MTSRLRSRSALRGTFLVLALSLVSSTARPAAAHESLRLGVVVTTEDPTERGRIRVSFPEEADAPLVWARVLRGVTVSIGDEVLVGSVSGSPENLVVLGRVE
jgi:hypothetical protein